MEVLLSVEGDGLGLDFALLDIDLVSGEDDWDIFADTDKVACSVSETEMIIRFRYSLRCQLGTFLYVIRDVTSNMMIPHCPLI